MTTIKAYARKEHYGPPLAFLKRSRTAPKSNPANRSAVFLVNSTARSSWPVETNFVRALKLSTGKAELNWPIKVEILLSGDYFVVKNEDLGVYSYGATQDEAKQNFAENFEDLLELYNSSRYEELTGDAIRLKALFDKIINK